MSAAFDSMERGKLLQILERFLPANEIRLVRVLMGNTTLQVKIMGKMGEPFITTRGTPQGDGLSPILFVIYLEAAMRELRMVDEALYGRNNGGKYWRSGIMEMSYADDVDLLDCNVEVLNALILSIMQKFGDGYNLKVNMAKTERKTIHPNYKTPTSYKKLGSHLDSDADVKLRLQNANLCFYTMWKTWNAKEVSLPVRVRLYNACIKSILLYNIAAGAYGETQIRKLESAHRRHLRLLLRVRWPDVVKNEDVYARTRTVTIRTDILRARWRYFRKALLRPRDHDNPINPCAMYAYFKHIHQAPKVRGVPNTLANILHKNLLLVGKALKTFGDYEALKELANDARTWDTMVEDIISRSVEESLEADAITYQKRKARESIGELERQQGIERPGRIRLNEEERVGEVIVQPLVLIDANQPNIVVNLPVDGILINNTVTNPNNKRKDPEPVINNTLEEPIAKRTRFQSKQLDNPGSIVRNGRRSETSHVYTSVNLGRDI